MTEQVTALRGWSTTPSSNNSAAPDGMPEGMPPSGVNDWGRKTMAELRKWYEQAQWIDFGHTPTRVSDTSFTVSGDRTLNYIVGAPIRVFGLTNSYGIISSATYSAPDDWTTIVVAWRSSAVTPTTPTSVWVSTLTPPNGAESAGYAQSWLDTSETHTAGKATATVALSISTGTVAVDLSQSNVFRLALTENVTISNPTNPVPGQTFNIKLKQDATGNRTVAWGNKFLVVGSVSLSATAYSVASCQYDETDDQYLVAITSGFA